MCWHSILFIPDNADVSSIFLFVFFYVHGTVYYITTHQLAISVLIIQGAAEIPLGF
jgi:hypothetical protein